MPRFTNTKRKRPDDTRERKSGSENKSKGEEKVEIDLNGESRSRTEYKFFEGDIIIYTTNQHQMKGEWDSLHSRVVCREECCQTKKKLPRFTIQGLASHWKLELHQAINNMRVRRAINSRDFVTFRLSDIPYIVKTFHIQPPRANDFCVGDSNPSSESSDPILCSPSPTNPLVQCHLCRNLVNPEQRKMLVCPSQWPDHWFCDRCAAVTFGMLDPLGIDPKLTSSLSARSEIQRSQCPICNACCPCDPCSRFKSETLNRCVNTAILWSTRDFATHLVSNHRLDNTARDAQESRRKKRVSNVALGNLSVEEILEMLDKSNKV